MNINSIGATGYLAMYGIRGTEGSVAEKSLSEINQSFKVLGSEMKVVTSQFDKNDNSIQALTARNQVLNKEIEAQKIETLRSALANIIYGVTVGKRKVGA